MTNALRYKAPPNVRRVRHWVCGIGFPALAVFTLTDVGRDVAMMVPLPSVLAPFWMPLLPAGVAWALLLWERRVANRAQRESNAGRPPCWSCGYCLGGLPPDRACPECGLPEAGRSSALRWAEFEPFLHGKVKETPDDAGS